MPFVIRVSNPDRGARLTAPVTYILQGCDFMQAHFKQNKILIDWLSFTVSGLDCESVVDLLGFNDLTFVNIRGGRGFKDRLFYDGVSIHYNGGDDDRDVWVEMSGQGCRVFESYGSADWIRLFNTLLYYDCRITRLDVAYDDFNGLLDLSAIVADTLNHAYVSKADDRSWDVHLSGSGTCVTIGKSKSSVSCRIYDKAAERGCTDVDHWVRCELQLRGDSSKQFCLLLCDHQAVIPSGSDLDGLNVVNKDGMSIDRLYFGVLNNYLRYIDMSANNDTNKWRKPCADHWERFAHSVTDDRISLWVAPGVEYNIYQLDNYVESQCSGAVCTYLLSHGVDYFFKKIISRLGNLNPKYVNLLRDQFCDRRSDQGDSIQVPVYA